MHWLTERGFPLLVAITLISVLIFSTIPPTLFVIGPPYEGWLFMAYAALLVLMAVSFPKHGSLHSYGAALSVLVFSGRAGGFLSLMLERDDISLIPALLERIVITVAMFVWHLHMAKQTVKSSLLFRN